MDLLVPELSLPTEERAVQAVAPPVTAPPRALRRCFDDLPVWTESAVPDLLDRAAAYFEADDAAGALACAEEAARQAPRSIEAHHDRAAALMRLGRLDDAREAVTLVLAMAPQDTQALELAADLYVNHLAPSSERAAIGLAYARRASRGAGGMRARVARVSLLEGQALIDLGQAHQALRPLSRAVAMADGDLRPAATYELSVALFELARFDEAREQLEAVLALEPDNAHALFHMGLVLERAGALVEADAAFARASELAPDSFPPLLLVSPRDFEERVRQALAALPREAQESLHDVPVETADLPALDDLVAESPPLSPTILGLFRGLPLGRHAGPQVGTTAARTKKGRSTSGRVPPGITAAASPAQYSAPERAILLYRRNLLRTARTDAELDEAIARTLLHEVGHLQGEDDGSLRDRGLE
ncbi:MAG: metallopeptidase family protein [Myxococcales bacterium]|nr:metallopeptidase family protein [Myxococcales bacterium]